MGGFSLWLLVGILNAIQIHRMVFSVTILERHENMYLQVYYAILNVIHAKNQRSAQPPQPQNNQYSSTLWEKKVSRHYCRCSMCPYLGARCFLSLDVFHVRFRCSRCSCTRCFLILFSTFDFCTCSCSFMFYFRRSIFLPCV